MESVLRYFQVRERGSTLAREVRGGCTTFFAMAYLVVVVPGILAQTGMDTAALMTAACLAAAFGSILMGLAANLPFALAPGLGFPTVFTLTLCGRYGYTWQQSLAVLFLAGLLFLLLSLTSLRERITDALPMPFKFALSAGIGLLLTLSGLINAGVVTAEGNLLDMGSVTSPGPLLALLGIFVTAALLLRSVPGALMLGMALVVLLGIPFGVTVLPEHWLAAPTLSPIFLRLDFAGLLSHGFFPLAASLLSFTLCDCFDTVGTLLGVGGDAKLTDSTGDLPGQKRAMVCDAASTCVGALLGVTTVTAMAESATGIREGARTGLASVVTGLLFLCAMPLAPLAGSISGAAAAAPLVMVGMAMMSGITQIHWKHVEVSLPCFLMIVGMPFTFSITTGIALGVVSYAVIMICRRRAHLVDPVLYALAAVFTFLLALGAL